MPIKRTHKPERATQADRRRWLTGRAPRGGAHLTTSSAARGGVARRAAAALIVLSLLVPMFVVPAFAAPVTTPGGQQQSAAAAELRVSRLPNRARASILADQIVRGDIFVFATPSSQVDRVRFFLDHPDPLLEDPLVAGSPYSIDDQAPYDLAGTAGGGQANPLDTRQLSNGLHTITLAIDRTDGSTQVTSAQFSIHNGQTSLALGPRAPEFTVLRGGRASTTIKVVPSSEAPTKYSLRSEAPWLQIEAPWLDPERRSQYAPGVQTLSVDASEMEPGRYTTTVIAEAPGHSPASLPVTVHVTGPSECSPVPCSEVLVNLPYQLDFSRDHGKADDDSGIGTGFTYVDRPTNGSGYMPENLAVDSAGPGTLKITTTPGIMFGSENSQDNALGVGIDAPSQITVLETTLRNLPLGTGNSEQAGLWFGNDESNYVKFEVISTSTGTKIQYLLEVNDASSRSTVTDVLNLSGAAVALKLHANPTNRMIAASYRINGGPAVTLDQFMVPAEFFSFDAAGIDPAIGTRSFGGIYATHRKGPGPLTYTFDNFLVVADSAPPPPDPSFTRTSFPVPNPTSLAWGPDGRLYVTELYGKIHAITLNQAKQVVSDQIITTLGSRLTLGIAIDPLSTPNNVVLWVSHSNDSASNGELNSGTITRLAGAGFATRQDVITGLPRAIANHATNSIHFGPDGKLYIAQGGNTGAGAANTANSEFGTRAEQPLSAALLVADVRAAGFDGTCATPANSYGPAPCDVVPYATGLRNTYDFVFHSNGTVYAPDNGLGVTGTYPPVPTPPCEGFGDARLWTDGGDNPGEQPDILLRLRPGKYYGHPNPYRRECVFKNGSYQGVTPPANYTAPLYNLGTHRSADGIIEYKSNAFNGALKGELLIANYSVGDDITRIKLSADGKSVVSARQLAGGLNNPLPLVEGPDGTIYVGEFGGSKVTALTPRAGSWATKRPVPAAVVDAGGAAIGSKIYVVAGKTSAGHQRSLYIYDSTTNRWTSGPSLPSEYAAVENPAVAAYNGKLYVFGGSTSSFAGAVASAAVFDPAAVEWTMLAAMPAGRSGATAQALNDKIYVIGGMSSRGASLASVAVYTPATNTWSSAPSMGTRRDNAGSAALGGKLYVFGGRTRNSDGTTVNGTLATVEMYDPSANKWTPRASMLTGRRAMAVGTANSRAQAIGGERTSSGGAFGQNEEYDPVRNSWQTLTPIPTPRHGAVAGTVGGVVYVAGGGPQGGSTFSNVTEAFTP